MSKGLQKLKEEYEYIKKDDLQIGAHAEIIDNIFHWRGSIIGPKGTPYSGGYFSFEIKFDPDYPNSPPQVQMRTPTYHPNINCQNGHICLYYLHYWNNTCNIAGLFLAIFQLLAYPNESEGYYPKDEKKAKEFRDKYGTTQFFGINWKISWDMGWDNNDINKRPRCFDVYPYPH